MTTKAAKICFLPYLSGLGGPVSFQGRLLAGLKKRGIESCTHPDEPGCTAVLVNGGTRRLDLLYYARRHSIKIVQRLDGMNWIHRKRRTGLRHYLRSEVNNRLLSFIRRHLADRIVYQSCFSQDWWQRVDGALKVAASVVFNGVDLQVFRPDGSHSRPQDHFRLLMVEGRLGGGNEPGLENAIALVRALNETLSSPKADVELMVVGEVPSSLRLHWEGQKEPWITWAGVARRDQIPEIDRSAHLLFSADLNAACPNSVIEALACGCPVIGFDTGALGELVQGDAGRVVDYGSNHWELEAPRIEGLAVAASEVLENQAHFRLCARRRAEEGFDLEKMVESYLQALL